MKRTDLLPRIISGVIYITLIFFGTTGHPWFFMGLMAAFMGFCLYEYFSMTELKSKLHWVLGLTGAALIFYYFSDYLLGQYSVFTLQSLSFAGPVLFIMAVYTILFSTRELYVDFGKATVGVIYIAVPFALALTIPDTSYVLGKKVISPEIFYIFLLIWVSDTLAYVAGSLFGKHPFAPKISGKKTWEGAIGGFVFTVLSGYLIQTYIFPEASYNWLVIGLIVAFFAPIGDLVESKLKRSFNTKDSGKLIPGHGGFLDRLDSFIFAVPMVYLYILLNSVL